MTTGPRVSGVEEIQKKGITTPSMSRAPTSTPETRGPETAHLARDLVRMESEAKRLERNGEYAAAQAVWAERDRLREFRSSLLRTQLRLRERRT